MSRILIAISVILFIIIFIAFAWLRYGSVLKFLGYSWWGVETHQRILDPTAMQDGEPIIFAPIKSKIGGDKGWLEQLIANGADINTNNGFGGDTPALLAAYSNQWENCYILLEHGANPDVHNESGISIANATIAVKMVPDSREEQFRQKVIEYLRAHNVAVPGPTPAEWRAKDSLSIEGAIEPN